MIIGINGKIGSGKDTIGKIIQYLTYPYDIDIQTYLNKEVNGQFEIKPNMHSVPNVEIKKFAGKLKQIASILTGIPVEKFEDQEFKKNYLDSEWGTVQDIPLNSIPPFADIKFNTLMTIREFLQKLGTEAMRDNLHTNVWVNALFADYKAKWVPTGDAIEEDEVSLKKKYPNWIITDMRFPNEMEAVEKRHGITIRVVRYPKTVEQSRGPENIETVPFDPTNHKHMSLWKGNLSRLHASETALDDAEFDYEIINDGTLEDLVTKVREILVNEELI
jgi:hypothetical protein